ncbi:MAG: hypothetical protein O6949_05340, partial [Chloroflexi bacterium]|nr:hypothetical protein [Chloroflexota bacterium]
MTQASEELASLAERLEALAREITEVADSAPSYDGQFGPKVRSLAAEGESQVGAISDHADALSTMLQVKAEEFAASDLQSESGFAGLQQNLRDWLQRAFASGPLSTMAGLLGLGWMLTSGDDEGKVDDDEELPWWAPWALKAANRWHGFDQRYGQPLREALAAIPRTWEGIGADAETIELYYTAQGWFWYDRTVNEPLSDLHGKFLALQGSGLSPNDPITQSLTEMDAVDSNGNPISPVGSELVDLVDGLGVRVAFIGTGGGMNPWVGQIVIPESYLGTGQITASSPRGEAAQVGLVAHELTHAAHRELNSPAYAPAVLDSTNHMEVVAYIVGETVEYDLLQAKLSAGGVSGPEAGLIDARLIKIENDLATYTGADGLNANRYMLISHSGNPIYQMNHIKESLIPGHRIPPGGWEQSLRDIGFTDVSIEHIETIANLGTAETVSKAEIGALGNVQTLSPTPT